MNSFRKVEFSEIKSVKKAVRHKILQFINLVSKNQVDLKKYTVYILYKSVLDLTGP